MLNITFLGTGLMGAPQARCLLAAGFPVRVWNRSAAKAQALVTHGALWAATPVEAVSGAEVVVCMLENGEIVSEVLFDSGVAQALAPGAVVIDMSSIKPQQARDHASRLLERGIHLLDAPVSGGVSAAEQGGLAIMVGGEPSVFSRVQAVLHAMGNPTLVGPHGSGQLAKLANQIIVGINIAAVCEALQMVARGGADPALVRQAIRGGFAQSRVLELHGQRMIERDFTPRARATMQLKDLDNALESARESCFQTPLTHLVRDLFADLVLREGDVDHSALWLQFEHLNGPDIKTFSP